MKMYWIEFLSTYYFLPQLKEKILKEITKRKIANCVSPFIFSLHFTLSPPAMYQAVAEVLHPNVRGQYACGYF